MFHIVTVKADKEEEEQTKFQQMQAEFGLVMLWVTCQTLGTGGVTILRVSLGW